MFLLRGSTISALAMAAASVALAQQTAPFRVDVKLVRITATVKNRGGEPVGGLVKENFVISDNGVPQQVAVFERQTDQPLSVVLMIDTSGSTAKDLKFEIDSASRFVRALLAEGNLSDSLSLWRFDADITQETNFTHRLDVLENKLKTIHGSAGTALYDAIYFGSRDLEQRQGRKVMIIVTDGGNTTSYRDSHQALEAAQLADAVVYPIVVRPITNDAGRNVAGENVLTFIAQGTGGRTFLPAPGAQLDQAFRDIISELRTEYLLGFYPHGVPPTKERFHKLQVRVNLPELQVFARNGYYGEAEAFSGSPASRVSVDPMRSKR